MNCCLCGVAFKDLSKHVYRMHKEEFARQQELCVRYYRSGLTFRQIADLPDVIYNNKTSVGRAVRSFISADAVAKNGVARRAKTRSISRFKEIFNDESLSNGRVYRRNVNGILRRAVKADNFHLPILEEFKSAFGYEVDYERGIVSTEKVEALVIPSSIPFAATANLVSGYLDAAYKKQRMVFYADEFVSSPRLINSMLRAKNGLSEVKVGARDCEIRVVDFGAARDFFNANHLCKHAKGELYLGLWYQGEWVAMMSMRRPGTLKYQDYVEIARFAVRRGTCVIGGFSRLLKAVERHYYGKCSKILSYCDLRYGSDGLYKNNGFNLVCKTGKVRFYSDGYNRYNKFKFMETPGLTEREAATQAGVFRMYGASSLIFEKDINI